MVPDLNKRFNIRIKIISEGTRGLIIFVSTDPEDKIKNLGSKGLIQKCFLPTKIDYETTYLPTL